MKVRECKNTITVVPLAENNSFAENKSFGLRYFRGLTLSKISYQELVRDSTLYGNYSQTPLIQTLRGASKVSALSGLNLKKM